jgi:acyl dehydratase
MIYVEQSLHFHRPVGLGDTITVAARVNSCAIALLLARHRVEAKP